MTTKSAATFYDSRRDDFNYMQSWAKGQFDAVMTFAEAYYASRTELLEQDKNISLLENDPRAPHATSPENQCQYMSQLCPDCQCILQKGHAKLGFLYCLFDRDAK